MTNLAQEWGQSPVTLRTVVRHAAELLHPKSHAGNYPALAYHPQLKVLAHQLVQADASGASPARLQELALDLLRAMKAASVKPEGEKFVRPASEITHRPAQIREQEQAARDLRAQGLKTKAPATPMPALFEMPTTPTKTAQPAKTPKTPARTASTGAAERAFFERSP